MSATVTLELALEDRASAVLAALRAGLEDLGGLHAMMAARAENLTRDWLRERAARAHVTARRLGAKPTGHLERAAENVTSRSDAESAWVGVTSPGITRAFHDVEIVPDTAAWLTLAVHRLSYGMAARDFERFLGFRLFRPLKKGARALGSRLTQGPGREGDRGANHRSKLFDPEDRKQALAAVDPQTKAMTVFYTLTKRVHQTQDRTMLPSDDDYKNAGVEAARDLIEQLKQEGAAGYE